jgi:hypothetical protein
MSAVASAKRDPGRDDVRAEARALARPTCLQRCLLTRMQGGKRVVLVLGCTVVTGRSFKKSQ